MTQEEKTEKIRDCLKACKHFGPNWEKIPEVFESLIPYILPETKRYSINMWNGEDNEYFIELYQGEEFLSEGKSKTPREAVLNALKEIDNG